MGAVASGIKVCRMKGVVVAAGLLAMLAGCTAFHTQMTVTSDERVSVVLQEVVDWSFEASHPATIGAPLLAKVLQGVRVGAEAKVAAYSRQDVDYLAPLLAGALAKAKREQLVAFRLKGQGGEVAGAGGGTLYVKGPVIYVTPLPARGTNAASFAAGVGFDPPDAAQGAKATTEAGLGESQLVSLIVDHWSLGKVPISTAVTAHPPSPAESPVLVLDPAERVPGVRPDRMPVAAPSVPSSVVAPVPSSNAPRPDTPTKTSSAKRTPVIGSKSVVPAPRPAAGSNAQNRNKSVAQPTKKKQPDGRPPQQHKALLELLKNGPEQTTVPADK